MPLREILSLSAPKTSEEGRGEETRGEDEKDERRSKERQQRGRERERVRQSPGSTVKLRNKKGSTSGNTKCN